MTPRLIQSAIRNPQSAIAALLLSSSLAVSGLHASQPKTLADIPDPSTDAEQAGFIIPEGFEINLWASDPMIRKPVQMNWDAQGRLWVVSSTTYPQIKPGDEVVDQVVVLEDTKHAGHADKATVFADGLHIPTAVMPGDGGCYVANSTEILFLKDTNGDGKADTRETILSGFGTEDTHHLIHTFRWTPEGMLSFNQSIYIHSHVETPWGVKHLMGGGVWEFRPETRKLDVFCKGFINPWGREFDRWGQSFVTDGAGSGGINFVFPQSVFATSPGAKRIIDGLNPGQPKQAGLEIVDEPHFPDAWQGTLITCDFRGNRINHFQLTESGSGYLSKQLPDVLASKHAGFRPIDVRIGPDGALYIADWYNPIIQHGEVDFRDPRRDHVHGRIWRLTAKGRPLSENPDWSKMNVKALFELIQKPKRRWEATFAKQTLKGRDPSEIAAALKTISKSAKDQQMFNADWDRAFLEEAWAAEAVNQPQMDLLPRLLASKDYHIRAAALRILSEHLADAPNARGLLLYAVEDENPQVRLWALACLNLFNEPEALPIALRVLDKPMDNNIDFLLDLTAREQADTWLPVFLKGDLKFDNPKQMVYALKASGKPEALQPLLDAVAGDKLSASDADSVFAAAGDTMTAVQAAGLAEMAEKLGDDSKNEQRQGALLGALVNAAQKRGIRPSNAEALVTKWLHDWKGAAHASAALLAGLWKIESARGTLETLASRQSGGIIHDAIDGLAFLGGEKSRTFINGLADANHPDETRWKAIEALTKLAPNLASKRAVEVLTTTKSTNTSGLIISAFIANKKLPDILAKELEGKTIPEHVAVEGIRIVSSRGIKGDLEAALQKAGNIKQMNRALTPEEMAEMMTKVKTEGDPHRGEQVFRRQQLLCFTCHAIGDGGGLLGPNLVSLGSAAPVDYIIESILEPSKKIKEGYNMTMVNMKDGQVMAGMIAQDGVDELVLRDAANQLHKLAKKDIAKRETSPISMMPPGLTATLREDEFVDLVRFLSELGKEGDYKIKPNRYVRTWRVMGPLEQEEVDHVRHTGLFALNDRKHVFPWQLSYSTVNGDLPLTELTAMPKMYPWFPKIAQFDLQMDSAGQVKLGLSEVKGVIVVVDDKEVLELTPELTLDLKAGTHVVSVLATRDAGDLKNLRVEILDGAAKVVTTP